MRRGSRSKPLSKEHSSELGGIWSRWHHKEDKHSDLFVQLDPPSSPWFFFFFLVFRSLFLPKPHFSTSCAHSWNALAPFDSFKNTFKTNGFSTFLLWPHQAHAHMHHTCHLMSRGSSFFFLPALWSLFLPKTTPARSVVRSVGVTGPLLTLQKNL